MIDDTPWLVGGGAEHSPEVARGLAYAATSGNEGIAKSADLRVLAQSVPNGSVRVMGGTASMLNKYAGGSGQTYIGRNASSTTVNISPTTSAGGRTDLVVMRILDPQYEGAAPTNPNTFQYTRLTVIQGVSSSIKGVASLNLNYPAIALAKVTLPASTATVTQSMITDLREMANPRVQSQIETRPLWAGDNTGTRLELYSRVAYPAGEWWPNAGGQLGNGVYNVDIPVWATRMQIEAEWLGVRMAANAGWGYVWVSYGPNAGSSTPTYYTQAYNWDANESNTYRTNIKVAQEVAIPAAWRGTTQPFVGRGTKLNPATGYAGKVELDTGSGMTLGVRFLEIPDLD